MAKDTDRDRDKDWDNPGIMRITGTGSERVIYRIRQKMAFNEQDKRSRLGSISNISSSDVSSGESSSMTPHFDRNPISQHMHGCSKGEGKNGIELHQG